MTSTPVTLEFKKRPHGFGYYADGAEYRFYVARWEGDSSVWVVNLYRLETVVGTRMAGEERTIRNNLHDTFALAKSWAQAFEDAPEPVLFTDVARDTRATLIAYQAYREDDPS